jgi:hypothetical protein
MQLRRHVDGISEPAIRQRSLSVLPHPANPNGLASPLPDGARADHPELPVRNVEHIRGRRFPLRLHSEDEDVSPHPCIHAVLVTRRIKLPCAEAPEHKFRMLAGPCPPLGRARRAVRSPAQPVWRPIATAGQVEPGGVVLRDGSLAGTGGWIFTRGNDRRLTTSSGSRAGQERRRMARHEADGRDAAAAARGPAAARRPYCSW